MPATTKSILGLDPGGKRVGVAVASAEARLPRPLGTLELGDGFFDELSGIITSEDAGMLVVGLPRGMDGQLTAQSGSAKEFAESLRERFGLPVHMQDESLTSKRAEAELDAKGRPYKRGDIDALAATYILQDWLDSRYGEERA